MAIITPPAPFPLRKAQWRRERAQDINRAWTGTTQIARRPGATRWRVSGEFSPIITQANALAWQAFMEDIDGAANSFPVRASEGPQAATGAPTVAGAGQTGSSLMLANLPGSVGSIALRAGQKISFPVPGAADGAIQLEVLRADLVVGAGQTGTALFRNWLRGSPPNGAAVEMIHPYALMRMASPVTGWDGDAGQSYSMSFDAEEAF